MQVGLVVSDSGRESVEDSLRLSSGVSALKFLGIFNQTYLVHGLGLHPSLDESCGLDNGTNCSDGHEIGHGLRLGSRL